jgi:hypothetical protein
MIRTPPLFIVGCIRSGTTILHRRLIKCCPQSIDLDDVDFEGRTTWQQFGCFIGTPKTGTRCLFAGSENATKDARTVVRKYLEKRSGLDRHILNKNPHLSNKILFVNALIPEAKIVFIVRNIYATVSSTKLHLQAVYNGANSLGIPFVHYWPDTDFPCWYTIPAFKHQTPDKLKNPWSRFLWLLQSDSKNFRHYLRMLIKPPSIKMGAMPHEDPDTFRSSFPDKSRYFPGEGFARIPEAWVTINANILCQLKHIPEKLWITIDYDQFCANTHSTIKRICEFIHAPNYNLKEVPSRLDTKRQHKWKKHLSLKEQKIVRRVLDEQEEHTSVVQDIDQRLVRKPN